MSKNDKYEYKKAINGSREHSSSARGSHVPSFAGKKQSPPRPASGRPAQESPERKKAPLPCPSFGKCGNCQMLDVPYTDQLLIKQRRMERLLGQFGKVETILGMKDPRHYRCKVHRVIGRGRGGEPVPGSYAQGTHFVIPVTSCLMEDEGSQKILTTIAGLLKSFRLTPYNEDTGRGDIRHILIRRGKNSGQVLVVLITPGITFPGKNNFVKALREAHPEITSIVLNRNAQDTDMVLGDRDIPLYGPGLIHDSLCGLDFRISPQSFYQVNPVQTEVLYRTAVDFAGLTGRETVIDAYCGIGTIGLIAAKKAGRVIGFELNASAVKDARLNAQQNRITNAQFYCGDAGKCMTEMAEAGEHADVVFMDPPRSGSTPQFISSTSQLGPKKIVYISCGPDSLARDLPLLIRSGYRVDKIQPVDMFPYTEHVETVVCLRREKL